MAHARAGAVAQLGERLVRNEEVSGSIPLSSTSLRCAAAEAAAPATEAAAPATEAAAPATEAAPPESENYKADQQFTTGWISLRFLNDSATAQRYFSELTKLSAHPVTVARARLRVPRSVRARRSRRPRSRGQNGSELAACRASLSPR